VDEVKGPSEQVLLWTVYVILVGAAIVAFWLLYKGQIVGNAGGSVLLAQVVASLKAFTKPPMKALRKR
jgi:hypothetical protein